MDSATILPVQVHNAKPTHEQRLASFIAKQKQLSQSRKKKGDQLSIAKARKEQSNQARLAVDALMRLLNGFGATVSIEHTQAPIRSLSAGETGYGEREIMFDIWFNEDDEEPTFGGLEDGTDCYVSANAATGYSVAKVVFPLDEEQQHLSSLLGNVTELTLYGKSICSANEVFNGNIGAFFALMDALHILSRKQDLAFPLRNLFFFAASLLPLRLEAPSHYEDSLNLELNQEPHEE